MSLYMVDIHKGKFQWLSRSLTDKKKHVQNKSSNMEKLDMLVSDVWFVICLYIQNRTQKMATC